MVKPLSVIKGGKGLNANGDLSGMDLLDAAELSKRLEHKWGVSAAAPVAVAAAGQNAYEKNKIDTFLKNIEKETREFCSFSNSNTLPKLFAKSLLNQIFQQNRASIISLIRLKSEGNVKFRLCLLDSTEVTYLSAIDVIRNYLHKIDYFRYSGIMDFKESVRGFLKDKFDPLANDFDLLVNEVAGVLEKHSKTISSLSAEFTSTEMPKSLPEREAVTLYANREKDPDLGRKHTAIEFYDLHWRKFADAGLLFQDMLKDRYGEDKLLPAIRSQCQRENLEAKLHLPPPKSARTDASRLLESNRARARQWQRDKNL